MACLAPLGFSEARLLGMRLLGRGYWPSMAKHTVSVGQTEGLVEGSGSQRQTREGVSLNIGIYGEIDGI